MSAKVSGKVWELMLDPMDKYVLLALSDHADHEGNNVRPGNELLCAKTGLSEKTIGVKIEKLTKLGLLDPVTGGTGRGRKRELSVDPDAGKRHPYFIERDRKKAERDRKKAEEASTFSAFQKSKDVQPLEGQKVELDNAKGRTSGNKRSNLTTEKVELDDNLHDKERARLNRHESSIEPSIDPSLESEPATNQANNLSSNAPEKEEAPSESVNQAYELYKKIFDRELPIHTQEQLGQVDDLAVWEGTLQAWRINGYSARQVFEMLRQYRLDMVYAAKRSRGGNSNGKTRTDSRKPESTAASTVTSRYKGAREL